MSPDLGTSFFPLSCKTLFFPTEELDTEQVRVFQRCHEKSCVCPGHDKQFPSLVDQTQVTVKLPAATFSNTQKCRVSYEVPFSSHFVSFIFWLLDFIRHD